MPPSFSGTAGSPDALARLRGPVRPQPYDARKIAALTANPGCPRRAVVDAAGVDKAALAQRIGCTVRFGQSPFAITRGNAFEDQVKRDGYAELLTLLRAQFDVPVAEATVADLNDVAGNTDIRARNSETLSRLRHAADGSDSRTIVDHPVLALDVAGQTAYLEPDAVTHLIGGQFHIVEIKSFSAIDGQADPAKVAEAAKQAAVYVIALRRTVESLGFGADLVSDRFVLVCPKDFSNRPFARLVDLRQQLDAVAFQLARLPRAEELAGMLPPGATFDLSVDEAGQPVRTSTQLLSALDALPARYTPDCRSSCELADHCRAQAVRDGEPAYLGTTVRDALPGIGSLALAGRFIDGLLEPDAGQKEAVDLLRAAARLRSRRLGGAV